MSDVVLRQKEAFEARRATTRQPGPVGCTYLDAWYAHRDRTPIYREAAACRALWSNVEIPLYPDERIPGLFAPREVVDFHYGSATRVNEELVRAYVAQEGLSGAELDEFWEKIQFVKRARYQAANPEIFTPEENASIQAFAATSTWFGGHMVLDYHTILSEGLDAYADKITACRTPDKREFYDALEIQLEAVQIYLTRYAQRARAAAREAGFDAARCLRMADDLAHVAHRPAADFRQGITLVWILHMLNGADSFGRFDDYLLALFENGRVSMEEAEALVACLFIKVEEACQIQNMTIGGENRCTTLTKMLLDVAAQLRYKGPNLCLRVRADMPEDIWESALHCLKTGIGLPALYNDEIYIANFARFGIPREIAQTYCLAGCSQVMLPGQCNFVNDIGMLNAAKVLEVTLYDGFDPQTGLQVGPHTGKAEDFADFEALKAAFDRQMDYFCELEAAINDKDVAYRLSREGYTLRTLFMRDCIERGKNIFDGGARYNNIELEVIGITNCADSLEALHQAVFERRHVGMEALMEALRADFEGNEPLRQYLLNRTDKFGNGYARVDELRGEIAGRIFQNFNERAAWIGGVYVPGEAIFVAHEPAGRAVGATPDGRHAGRVLADSSGAAQGMDRNGPTALLQSALHTPVDHLLTTVVLNMRFTAATFQPARVRALLETFFAEGGMQVQLNVCDADELRRALENPEAYRSLVVRVGGYSDYYVNLSPALQQEILRRTEYVA